MKRSTIILSIAGFFAFSAFVLFRNEASRVKSESAPPRSTLQFSSAPQRATGSEANSTVIAREQTPIGQDSIDLSAPSSMIGKELMKIIPKGTDRDEAFRLISEKLPHESTPVLNRYEGVLVPRDKSGVTAEKRGASSIHVVLGRSSKSAAKRDVLNLTGTHEIPQATVVASWAFDQKNKLAGVYVSKSID